MHDSNSWLAPAPQQNGVSLRRWKIGTSYSRVISFAIEIELVFALLRPFSRNAGATGGEAQHPCAKKCLPDVEVFFFLKPKFNPTIATTKDWDT
jgi:hypothetical protein